MTTTKNYAKIPPPPPVPPLILLNYLSKVERLPIYQPNRDMFGNITNSLGNISNVERHIRDTDFQRKKEYDKKSNMCKNFKEKNQSNASTSFGFFGNVINNIKSGITSTLSPKSSSQPNKKDKLPKGAIILDINTTANANNYRDNIINWSEGKINKTKKSKKPKVKKTLKKKLNGQKKKS